MRPSSSSTLWSDLATSSVLTQQPARLAEDAVEHGFGEPACLRVLTARMVRRDDQRRNWRCCVQTIHRAVLEARPGTRQRHAVFLRDAQERCKGNLAQRHYDASAAQQREFLAQVTGTIRDFLPGGLVVRRRAANCRRDERILQLQAVVATLGRGLRGKSGSIERAHQPLARTITGEHPPRPVASVRGGCEAEDQEFSVRIPESGKRFAPVLPGSEFPFLDARDTLTVANQARALPAGDDCSGQTLELSRHDVCFVDGKAEPLRISNSIIPASSTVEAEPRTA